MGLYPGISPWAFMQGGLICGEKGKKLYQIYPRIIFMRSSRFHEVLKELQSLRGDTPTGPDNIPAPYIKLAIEVIYSPLTHIINSFISHNAFPTSWKKARIEPIGKSTNPSEKGDFRPISILPVLSKIFEKLVANQVVSFIESMHIYNNTISGFRKCFSTVMRF